MGPSLVTLGVAAFIAMGPLSMSAYRVNNPERHASGQPPRKGSGDVPPWISKLYFGAIAMIAVGAFLWITGD